MSSFYILDINSFQINDLQIFSPHSLGYLFTQSYLKQVVSLMYRSFNFDEVKLV